MKYPKNRGVLIKYNITEKDKNAAAFPPCSRFVHN